MKLILFCSTTKFVHFAVYDVDKKREFLDFESDSLLIFTVS